jgi:enoyl-CoA hydratase
LVLAARLADQPAQALRGTKRAINKQLEQAVLMVLEYAVSAEAVSGGSAEHRASVERMRDWMDRP